MKIPLPAFNTNFGHGHHDRAQPEVQFYFDIVCPYAYLASQQLPKLCEELGALVDYRPILLGGVLKALSSEPSQGPAAKTAMTLLDVQRWAMHLDVPLSYPAAHPQRTVEAMRLLCWAPRLAWPRLIAALYRAYWAEGRDVTYIEVLVDIAQSVGIDADGARRGLQSPQAAAELRRRTSEAIEQGVFGVPTFIVEGHSGPRLFFGQDRLHFVREAILHHPLFQPPHAPAKAPSAVHVTPQLLPQTVVENEARRVTFFYDFASPFAYLASTQIEGLAARCGALIDWQPILLGGLFRTLGTPIVPIATYPEAKRRHSIEDMSRWAHHYGEPFHFPSRFPMTTVTALRLALLAGDRIAALSQALFRAYWVADEDLEDEATLERALQTAGLETSLLARVAEPEVKERLRHNTEEAARLGVFGVPSFHLAQHHGPQLLFFGQDRLLFVEKALRDGTSPALAT
jgi:2-hydroxychromene-2-carboxylate isomerase